MRRPSARLTALATLVANLLLLCAGPALAQAGGHEHGADPVAAGGTGLATALRGLVLAATAVVAGAALLRPLSGPPSDRSDKAVLGAAVLAAAGLGFAVLTVGTVMLWAVAQAAFTVLVPVLLRHAFAGFAAGAVLTAVLVWESVTDHNGLGLLVGGTHAVAAILLFAAAVLVVAREPGTRRPLLRRLAPVAVAAGVVLLGTGLARAWQAQLRPDATSLGSAYGQMVLLKAGLLVATAAMAVATVRGGGRHRTPRDLTARTAAAALAAALLAGASLAALTPPAAPAEPGRPALRTVMLAGHAVPVAVAPQRPGPNLVYVGTPGLRVGTEPRHLVTATARGGVPGGWAVVHLPEGRSQLWIEDGTEGGTDQVPLRLHAAGQPLAAPQAQALTGPDGPECFTALIGAALAGRSAAGCPADGLAPSDATTLRVLVGYLGGRGLAVHPVVDGSPRSAAALAEVRVAAARYGVTVDETGAPTSAVLLLGGGEQAERLLAEHARGAAAPAGVYLAPWLATGPLLGHGKGAVTALRFDARGELAQRYLAELRTRGGTGLATPAGLAAWLGAWSPLDRDPVRLYASAQVSFLPAELGHAHDDDKGWVPGGTLTPVSPPLGT